MLTIKNEMNEYLKSSHYINWEDEQILQKAQELKMLYQDDELALIRATYHFVRDEIKHSWDIQDQRVTITAADVLREKVGICWTKSNLLAGLLRANGIPAGLCYQRLILKHTPERAYCIHALNAVYCQSLKKWIRLDARGNKAGVNAEMNITNEQLAFPVNPEMGEIDYKEVYAVPPQRLMNVLENNTDALYMYLHALPDSL